MSLLSHEHEPVKFSATVNPSANVTVRTEGHIQGYCVKCHAKAEIKNPHHLIMKNKRHAVQGICPKCGTKMVKFG
jgi:Zn finger protein HypA/HybF involved in hydrogenase expression